MANTVKLTIMANIVMLSSWYGHCAISASAVCMNVHRRPYKD